MNLTLVVAAVSVLPWRSEHILVDADHAKHEGPDTHAVRNRGLRLREKPVSRLDAVRCSAIERPLRLHNCHRASNAIASVGLEE